MNANVIKKELRLLSSKERAETSAWFFKTEKGQYGYGDVFIGVTVPEMRKVAKKYISTPLAEVEKLLHSKEHEFRFTALIILVLKYKKGDEQKNIYDLYMRNLKWVNNWDLVDCSAHYIVGEYLLGKNKDVLKKLATSPILWERRIAIISTFTDIYAGKYTPAFTIARMLLKDEHDLIHKAVGWMLREVGKKCSQEQEEVFLKKYYKKMPRTMLRYAIEHFPEKKRKAYLKGEI